MALNSPSGDEERQQRIKSESDKISIKYIEPGMGDW
jgi:hypothetical protein